MDKTLQAKNIAEADFLSAMKESMDAKGYATATRWDVAERLGLPDKLVNAKAATLIRRRVITGCTCGCRGDWAFVVVQG
jgi:hypothetical protein